MFCTNCGRESQSAFCSNCGTPMQVPSGNHQSGGAAAAPQALTENISGPAGTPSPSTESVGATTPARRKVPLWAFISGGAAILAVVVIVVFSVSIANTNPFEKALEDCALDPDGSYIFLTEDGKSLVMDGSGEESVGADYSDQLCVLNALDMPSSTETMIGNTNALQGVVEDSWNDIDASWTYHPDDGFDIILEWTK